MIQTVTIFKFNERHEVDQFHSPQVNIKVTIEDVDLVRFKVHLYGNMVSYQGCKFDLVGNGRKHVTESNWVECLESAVLAAKSHLAGDFALDASEQQLLIEFPNNNVGSADFKITHPKDGVFYILTNIPSREYTSGWPIEHACAAYHSDADCVVISQPRMSKHAVRLLTMENDADGSNPITTEYLLQFQKELTPLHHAHLIYFGAKGIFDIIPAITVTEKESGHLTDFGLVKKYIRGITYFQSVDKKLVVTFEEDFESQMIDAVADHLTFSHLPHDVKTAIHLKFQNILIHLYRIEEKAERSAEILKHCTQYWDQINEVETSLEFLMGPL